MHKIFSVFLGAGLSIALNGSAQALNTRTWVASNGTDNVNCGLIETPCRSLQYAHDHTAAGGEIDVKDSAGYGSVAITKAINIVGSGSIAGVLASPGADAITINAGPSDTVVLRGLTVEGAGVGYNGIVFVSGSTLDVADCVIQNFAKNASDGLSGNGILLRPSAGSPTFLISNTNTSHNAVAGLVYFPQSGSGAIAGIAMDRVIATRNKYGIVVQASNTSGATIVSIANSIAFRNADKGVELDGSLLKGEIDFCHSDENGTGYFITAATVAIGRSVAAHNTGVGLFNNGGTVSSYKDNRFNGNSAPTSGTIGNATLY